jgi:hypothetical protein
MNSSVVICSSALPGLALKATHVFPDHHIAVVYWIISLVVDMDCGRRGALLYVCNILLIVLSSVFVSLTVQLSCHKFTPEAKAGGTYGDL